MARNLYGCTSADFTLTESGRVVAGATVTVWTARTGGTQVTDLTDIDGDAITLVTSDADGGIRFYGVDGDKDTYWLDTGTGARIAVRPVDLTGEIGPTPDLTIGTVTTGTAAATITGTDAAPVLNLTLPTAGANGVNTAAIQDGAVTAAKLATSGRFVFPTGAANGYGFASGAVHLSGTGTPEGVVTAAPGSTWLQTDATTDVKGWIRWVKATGTGNTDWVAGPEADTGRRNVVADIDADWAANASAGYIRLQRVGERVYFEARLDRVTASGSRDSYDAVYTVPSGFAPRNAHNIRGLAAGPSGAQGYVSDPSIPGRMDVWFLSGGTWAAGDDVVFTAEWYTNDSWPSSLPGSAI